MVTRLIIPSLYALLMLAMIGSLSTAMAKDADGLEAVIKQGRAKAQNCTRCHGRDGISQFVKKAGWEQSISTYVIKQLLLFRGKRRKHDIMNSVTASLSNIDIYEIALWYESVSKK